MTRRPMARHRVLLPMLLLPEVASQVNHRCVVEVHERVFRESTSSTQLRGTRFSSSPTKVQKTSSSRPGPSTASRKAAMHAMPRGTLASKWLYSTYACTPEAAVR